MEHVGAQTQPARKKYFFFDIDGTLTTENPGGIVPKSTIRTLEALRAKGHFVCIATGRSQAKALEYTKALGFDNVVSDGGNGITIGGKIVEIVPLPLALCKQLIADCEKKGFPWGVSTGNLPYRTCKDGTFWEATHDTFMKTLIAPDFDYTKATAIYKVYVACLEEQESQLPLLSQLPFARYHKEYIFVEPDDKSVGIRRMMDTLHAPYQDVVVFGDGKNDLKMFRPEWTSIAMGNGIEALKRKATFVTKRSDEDGIEYACKHFGWID
ncbi:MAG: HAD hydrolase family protein [Clostridiales bacterium]|jgi:hypothetical protein|nr:HAD hydrolase family protein [Clostridiales bacterium]